MKDFEMSFLLPMQSLTINNETRIGTFCLHSGLFVYRPLEEQIKTMLPTAYCKSRFACDSDFKEMTREDWEMFREKMFEVHGITIDPCFFFQDIKYPIPLKFFVSNRPDIDILEMERSVAIHDAKILGRPEIEAFWFPKYGFFYRCFGWHRMEGARVVGHMPKIKIVPCYTTILRGHFVEFTDVFVDEYGHIQKI